MSEQPKAIEDMTPEELREEVRIANREAYDAQRKVESLLMERAQWERDVAVVIRRGEWNKVRTYGAASAQARARNMVQPVEAVLYRIEQLGERASAKQVAGLKTAVRDARSMLGIYAKDDGTTGLDGEAEAEIARLREVIVARGQELHRAAAGPPGGTCRCPGCELIRAMDADSPAVLDAIREVAQAAS